METLRLPVQTSLWKISGKSEEGRRDRLELRLDEQSGREWWFVLVAQAKLLRPAENASATLDVI
jgi:hypothetical protein